MGKSPALKALLLAVIISTAGCATLDNTPQSPDAAWFDSQLSANQYAVASAALKKWKLVQPDDAQLMQMEKDYTAAAAQFRRQAVHDAGELQAQQRWGDADQRLLTAMQQLPDDEAFVVHYRKFDTVREAKRRQAQYDFDVAYAQNLPQMLLSARAIFELKPQDDAASARLGQLQDDAVTVAARLVQSAQAAQVAGDVVVAERDYRLAAALTADETLAAKSEELAQQLAKTSAQKQRVQQRTAQVNLQSQLRELDDLLEKNQLEAAQQLLGTLRQRYGNNGELASRQIKFDALRQKAVSNAIERGRRHYSAGELAKAIDVWERAYLLDPGNVELRDRIDRARRFRAKVEALQ